MPVTPEQLVRAQMQAFETAVAAGTTIAFRLPMLWAEMLTGNHPAPAEKRRMVQEKVKAASDGAMAAGLEWSRLWWRAMSGNALTPAQTGAAMLRVAEAAARPARSRAKRNATRLTRKALGLKSR